MKCSKCGAEIKSTLKFCNKCGAKIVIEDVKEKELNIADTTIQKDLNVRPVEDAKTEVNHKGVSNVIETSNTSDETNSVSETHNTQKQAKSQIKIFGFRSGNIVKKIVSVLYMVFCGLVLFSIVTTEREIGISMQDFIINQIDDFMMFLVMISPYIFLSNSSLRDKLPIFKKKKLLSDILGIVLFAIIVIVISSILDGAHTDEYKNLVSDNGENIISGDNNVDYGKNNDSDAQSNQNSNEMNSTTDNNGQTPTIDNDLNNDSTQTTGENTENPSTESNVNNKHEEPTYQYVLDDFKSDLYLLDYYRQITYARENNISVIRFPEQEKELFRWLSEIHTDGCYLDFTAKNTEIHIGLNEGYFRKINTTGNYYYIGEMHGNKPHGIGILYSRSSYTPGTIDFDGEWFNIAYVGWFKNGSFDGFGMLYNETQYLDYLDDNLLKVYENIYSEFGNMVSYFGMFSNGVRSGLGNHFYELSINNIDEKDGTFEYRFYNVNIGEFSNDALNGRGKSHYDGFLYYEGDFKNGIIHGSGKLYYFLSEILQYEGEFDLGYKNGTGIAYSEDGEVIHNGEWEFDEPKY